jgi:hypothetical protein
MKLIYVSLAFFAVLLACKKEDNTNISDFQCDETISFTTQVKPLIDQNCNTSGCHNASAAGGYVLLNHAQISDNASRILNSIQHKSGFSPMPQGAPKFSDEQIRIVACWIEQGKPNN